MAKSRPFLIALFEFYLASDDATRAWVGIRPLRASWAAFLIGAAAASIIGLVVALSPLGPVLRSSQSLTTTYRLVMLACAFEMLVALVLTAFHYYRYAIRARSLRFKNVISIYVTTTLLFGGAYLLIYLLDPRHFNFVGTTRGEPTYMQPTGSRFKLTAYFMIYSASQSLVGVSFYAVQSQSLIVSLLNVAQSLLGVVLLSLVVASYVNQQAR